MHIDKLFQILVVGGALLGGQSLSLANTEFVPEGVGAPASQELQAEGVLGPIFCTSEEACPLDACGHRKVKEGFECCWGTSCDTLP